MKHVIAILYCFLFVCEVSFSQEKAQTTPPEDVKKGFSRYYPQAQEIAWEKVKFGYEADFKNEDKFILALFSSTGELVKTETDIEEKELPESAREYIGKNFTGEKISESKQVKDAKGTVLYKADVQGKTLLFEKKGKYIGVMDDEEEDDEEDEEDDDDHDDKKKEEKKQ